MHITHHKRFLDPEAVLRQAGIAPKNIVADFGCAAGYFTFAAARMVGEEGHVYAFDILPSAVEAVESTIRIDGIDNVTVRQADILRGTGLGDGSVDVVIIKNVLFMVPDREAFLKEAHRVLHTKGTLVVVEWSTDSPPTIGPSMQHRIPKESLRDQITSQKFDVLAIREAGRYHYSIVAKKS